ncbi:MAG TPA: M48 family metalloprotease [Noviherbaspirillum sp.]|jgi:predicted Zn-dependent protease|uniref:M48 family metalloprotease n=1 Tax=Noviherbaspirillum sp. TaxID=1926288 RepID=UPI002DDDA069|nr:M48 family metalloprotease [Noviherbaspirillum sp.]HEV2609703.1 M48 family metalloprotease [Noviherbaspirillum sp.]
MKTVLPCFVFIASLCSASLAQVPETGRWQDLDFSKSDVSSRTDDQYWDMLVDLSKQGRLDDDPTVLGRVKSIASGLIQAAATIKPEIAAWNWEIHTTSAPGIDAFCMAGGKLMVGSEFVRKLQFDDGELATLIGHEVAHAVADHHREFLSSVLHISPLPATSLDVTISRLDSDLSLQMRMASLSSIQESEADQLGMILTHRAGWPAAAMVSFYRKLVATEKPSILAASHPSATSRLSMAKGMAALLEP